VSEADLHARHQWLVDQTGFRERMLTDPEFFDAKVAGWWVWGISQWIGSGWCSGDGPWHAVEVEGSRQLVHLGNAGRGINRQLVHLGNAGRGDDEATPDRASTASESTCGVRAAALVFASAAPVTKRALNQLLPDDADADAVIEALRARYQGRGVELVDAGGGFQFRTAPDMAPRLRRVIQLSRRLPRVAMETLAIVAYHQPLSRSEIEHIRGTALSQQTLEALLEAGLIEPKGRRETPGRPTTWGTTPAFLTQFGLKDLRELPPPEDLLLEPPKAADGEG
jgi:segregation and condensation protein B